jgi:hypothetical protein
MKTMDHAAYQAKCRSLTEDALRFIARDAKAAIAANPEGENVGYYADEICYCVNELWRREHKAGRVS